MKFLAELLGLCITVSFVYAALHNERGSHTMREGAVLTALAFGGVVGLSVLMQLLSLLG